MGSVKAMSRMHSLRRAKRSELQKELPGITSVMVRSAMLSYCLRGLLYLYRSTPLPTCQHVSCETRLDFTTGTTTASLGCRQDSLPGDSRSLAWQSAGASRHMVRRLMMDMFMLQKGHGSSGSHTTATALATSPSSGRSRPKQSMGN